MRLQALCRQSSTPVVISRPGDVFDRRTLSTFDLWQAPVAARLFERARRTAVRRLRVYFVPLHHVTL